MTWRDGTAKRSRDMDRRCAIQSRPARRIPLVWTAAASLALLVATLLIIYRRVNAAWGHVPFVHAEYVPHDESKPHAHALTSTILFDDSTVTKIYAPGFVPRAIYWLAFQAEFPYIRNRDALEAAVHRRNLAGMLTAYWYGSSLVAAALGIDEVDGRLGITSTRILGKEPADRDAARAFLFDLTKRFDEAGLPTWQVDPRQPRAMDNILETPDGKFHIIDLESGLVSPLASPKAWWRAVRRAQIPIYDDLYFDLLWEYMYQHRAAIQRKCGAAWFAELQSQLIRTENATLAWHMCEPRIWSRSLGATLDLLGLRAGWSPESGDAREVENGANPTDAGGARWRTSPDAKPVRTG